MKSVSLIISLIVARTCHSCKIVIDHSNVNNLCFKCLSKLLIPKDDINESYCGICQNILENVNIINKVCFSCRKNRPKFSQVHFVSGYNFISKSLIKYFKYHKLSFVSKTIANLMRRKISLTILDSYDIICPVPLHKKRFYYRLFNQSYLIARDLHNRENLHGLLIPDLLIKTRHTPPQSTLKWKARNSNREGLFKVNPKYIDLIKDKNIVIVDDVVTTGSTVRSCAEELYKYSPKNIEILCFARANLGDEFRIES